MSDLQHLRESILNKATEEGQALLSKAREEHEQLFNDKKERIVREKMQIREHVLNQANQKLARLEQQVQNEQRQEILLNRQQLVDQLINGAIEKMSTWTSQEWLAFIEKVLSQMEGQSLELVLGDQLKERLDLLKLNEIISANNNLILNDIETVAGVGFILRENRIDYNFLVDSMISSLRENLSTELIREVFAN